VFRLFFDFLKQVQKSGNDRNQFGENVKQPTNSSVLLDILGRDVSGMEKVVTTGKDGKKSNVMSWKLKTVKASDGTYQN